jgi:hypothetical protein
MDCNPDSPLRGGRDEKANLLFQGEGIFGLFGLCGVRCGIPQRSIQ